MGGLCARRCDASGIGVAVKGQRRSVSLPLPVPHRKAQPEEYLEDGKVSYGALIS